MLPLRQINSHCRDVNLFILLVSFISASVCGGGEKVCFTVCVKGRKLPEDVSSFNYLLKAAV